MQAARAEECGRQEAELATLRAENQSLRESHDQLTTEKLLLADRLDSRAPGQGPSLGNCTGMPARRASCVPDGKSLHTEDQVPALPTRCAFNSGHGAPTAADPGTGWAERADVAERGGGWEHEQVHPRYVERVGPAETPVERVG